MKSKGLTRGARGMVLRVMELVALEGQADRLEERVCQGLAPAGVARAGLRTEGG